MASKSQDHEETLEKLRKQLAVAVRSIQWSYAIFWSLSTREKGVLEWGEGYYNGDIKTRKTVHANELKAEKIGLQRSEQLRELYISLLEGENDQQAKTTSSGAALSPDDLTDAEWYYLVCMSFVFKPGQSLPGRALANGQTIWLCDAQHADCKVFSRSLLAKSASIQTVVCFPHLEGVIEIGVTELVSEDLNLLQHIKASLLDFSKPDCSENLSCLPQRTDDDDDSDKDQMCAEVGNEIVGSFDFEKQFSPSEDSSRSDQRGTNEPSGNHEEFNFSPDECSNRCEHDHLTEGSFMPKGLSDGASQIQTWGVNDDDCINGVQEYMNSSDCILQAFINQERSIPSPKHANPNHIHLKEFQKFNQTKLSSLDDLGADEDFHYKRTLSAILGGSSQLVEHPCFRNCDCKSSFTAWKKGHAHDYRPQVQQKMLKKILFTVPFMYDGSSLELPNKELGENWLENSRKVCNKHVEFEKSRENDNFLVLRSMVQSIAKTDQEAILNDTICYLKELEARVEELEARTRKKYSEMVEQTSDNYGNKNDNERNTWLNKRKTSEVDETEPDQNMVIDKDYGQPLNLKVSVKEQEVLIDMRCPYKEFILLDIIDAINHLHLDAHSVQSSTLDGVFTLTLKSKFRGAAIATVGMIKEALWKASK
ncbi:Basic helix-loop-helix transcription factor [Trema orientale]|uniref:Basic helix-loop-helix transcription factor n=1 Tax=Trema orientale TaxID=63057 RepID=A0A2P5F2R5_TREOI|nr:Basic helix-loop-helix transcription factor [Trema orientale]